MPKSASTSKQAAIATITAPTVDELMNNKYLDQTVTPALLLGLHELVKERPSDPLDFLAAFLLKYKKEKVEKSVSKT